MKKDLADLVKKLYAIDFMISGKRAEEAELCAAYKADNLGKAAYEDEMKKEIDWILLSLSYHSRGESR